MQEPIGTIGILCPDEAPLLGFISTVMPAIAVGNTIVAVPSELYPLITADLYQLFESSDLPAGAVNIVTGRPTELLKDPRRTRRPRRPLVSSPTPPPAPPQNLFPSAISNKSSPTKAATSTGSTPPPPPAASSSNTPPKSKTSGSPTANKSSPSKTWFPLHFEFQLCKHARLQNSTRHELVLLFYECYKSIPLPQLRFNRNSCPARASSWAGQPQPSIIFHKEDTYLIPFSFLWGGLAIFWEGNVAGLWGVRDNHHQWTFGILWGIPFVLIGQ